MHGLLAILIYPHVTTWHCLILNLFWVTSQCPIEVQIVRTDISAVSLTATAFSALEVCESQYAVGFSTSSKTHPTP